MTLRNGRSAYSRAPIEITQLTVNGIATPVRCAGDQSKAEAVVFVHGNPGSSEDFVDLLARVGDFARAVAPDMPGYGKAGRPEEFEYTVDGYAAHLDATLKTLGIERAHLVLHDFGGMWGMTWAAAHVSLTASLTLFNLGALPDYRWHKYAKVWRTPILGELFMVTATRAAFGWMLNRDNPKPFPPAFIDRMYNDMDKGMKRAVLKLYRDTNNIGDRSVRVAMALGAVKVPVLILWGTEDPFLSVRYANEQSKVFPGCEVHKLPGCGHWPFIDQPERVAELVIPYLKRQTVSV